MKLLLDENISFRLVAPLQASFPGSSHVGAEGLERATDVLKVLLAQAEQLTSQLAYPETASVELAPLKS